MSCSQTAIDEANTMSASFADRLGLVLGDRLVGVYLVGSYALGDMQAGSDVDVIVVVGGTVTDPDVSKLRELHAWMASTYPARPFEGFYADLEDLRLGNEPCSLRMRFAGDELHEREAASLIERETLRRCGAVVAGRPAADLGVFDSSAHLAAFSHRNLSEYWAPWLERTAPRLMGAVAVGPLRKQAAWAAAWCVLGVTRLHAAIADGNIVSKTEAGRRALKCFDAKWHPVVNAALDYRLNGDGPSTKRLGGLRSDARAFSSHVVEAALALPV